MKRIRADHSFRLPLIDVKAAVGAVQSAGSWTWTLHGQRHEHTFTHTGEENGGHFVVEYDTIYHGHQCMVLIYEKSATGRRLWCCPASGCSRLVATLYRPHGGAHFLCRHCWGITYASKFVTKEERLWRKHRELWDVIDNPITAPRTRLDALRGLGPLDEVIATRFVALEKALDRVQRRPVIRRSPGRPSKRAAREYARLVRNLNHPPVRPPRSPGRPRVKRQYRRHSIPVLRERMDEMQAYCPRCRDRREMVAPKPVTFKNGRHALQGQCAICKATMARIVKQSDAR